MDGLSSGASILAVLSLAIQLADSVKKIYEFWESVQDAPEAIRHMTSDLRLLAKVLNDTAACEERYGASETTAELLSSCKDRIEAAEKTTEGWKIGLASSSRRRRKWSAVKSVFKEDKVLAFLSSIEKIKTTLILARQAALDRSLHARFDAQHLPLQAISENLAPKLDREMTSMPTGREFIGQNGAINEAVQRLNSSMCNKLLLSSLERGISNALQEAMDSLPQPTTLANSIQLHHRKLLPHRHNETKKQIRKSVVDKKTFFGTVRINSRTFKISRKDIFKSPTPDQDPEEETRTWITVRPAPWIVSLGLKYGINAFITQSNTSWKHTLNTFRPVSDDAHIWKLIQWAVDDDDAQEIMECMARGEASIWDTCPNGRTPLMAAAAQEPPNLALCKMLIAAGSTPNITDTSNWSPFSIYTHWHAKHSTDVLRLWVEAMDLDRDELWIGLRGLARAQAASSSFDIQNSPFVWLFNQLQPEPTMGGYDKLVSDLLLAANARAFWWFHGRVNERNNYPNSGFFQYLLDLFPDLIDVVRVKGGQTVLFHMVISGCYQIALQLVNAGAELHRCAQGHTITSKNLLSSHRFFKWQKLLRTAVIDLNSFAKLELEQEPLRRDGWEADTLLQVLKLDFVPVKTPPWKKFNCRCLYSEQEVVDVKWQIMLNQMKRREDFGELFQSFAGDLQPTSCDINLFDGGDETSYDNEDESPDSDDEIESGTNSRINKPKRAEDFNWLCEKCWRKLKNGDIGGIKSRNEVYRHSEEGEDSYFLLSI